MSTIGPRHKELDENGEGLCSVPMWIGGMPGGFCDNAAYGERPSCEQYRNGFTGEMQRTDGRYNGYVPALACPGHGGPPKPPATFRTLTNRAVDVLQRHIVPDGLGDHEALNELYAIFDGPEYREAMGSASGERSCG